MFGRYRNQIRLITLFIFVILPTASQFAFSETAGEVGHERFVDASTYQITRADGTFSEPIEQKPTIQLRNRQFDPLVNRAPALEKHNDARYPAGEELAWIVQFETIPLDHQRDAITEMGGRVAVYIPDQAHIVLMTDDVRQKVETLDFVRWVGAYRAEYKLDLAMNIDADLHTSDRTQEESTRYSIMVLEPALKDSLLKFIEEIGGEINHIVKDGRRLEATLTPAQLSAVSKRPETLFIDLWSSPETDLNKARASSGATYIESVEGYSGEGVRGEVMDTGLLLSHQDFQSNPPLVTSNSTDFFPEHGTSTYGILFGDGSGEPSARGFLADGQGIFTSYYNFQEGGPADRLAHTQDLVDPNSDKRAVFQSNSWGWDQTTDYTTISAELDDIIFETDLLIVNSMSNTGNRNSRPQAWAKNVVSIGGYHHGDTLDTADDRWDGGASIGPASDGRIKPDLSFYYDYVTTTTADGGYRPDFGGTSAATPLTAGQFGLFFQMWADGVFQGTTGLNRDVFDSRPHASTAKAVMVNTANQHAFDGTDDDMTRVHQGWGTASVQNAYNRGVSGKIVTLIDETEPVGLGETNGYTVDIPVSDCPLRTTMVYNEPGGAPSAAVHRINDLNLKLTSPDGTVYWGNNGLDVGKWSVAGGVANAIDPVENIFVQNPMLGEWSIQVIGQSIVQDTHSETSETDADYALVVSAECDLGPVDENPAYIISPTPTTPLPCTDTHTFTWSNESAGYYILRISTLDYSTVYYAGDATTDLSAIVSTIPNDGSIIQVDLYTMYPSFVSNSYTYQTCDESLVIPPSIISPDPTVILPCASIDFIWTDVDAYEYSADLGTVTDPTAYYSEKVETQTTFNFPSPPEDGSTLILRLGARYDDGWVYRSYTYTTCTYIYSAPTLLSPQPNTTLTSCGPVTFEWTSEERAIFYILSVGTPADIDLYYHINQGENTSVTIEGLPEDGTVLNVRLWVRYEGVGYVTEDYEVTACTDPIPSTLLAPTPDSLLECGAVGFEWSDQNADEYYLEIGSFSNPTAYYSGSQGTETDFLFDEIPEDASIIKARLGTRYGTTWFHNEYSFTSCSTPSGNPAQILFPIPNTNLVGDSVTFIWTDERPTSYSIAAWGPSGFFFFGQTGQDTSFTFDNLPTTGEIITVRVTTHIGSQRLETEAQYTTYIDSAEPAPAVLLNPAPNTFLADQEVTFTWSDENADEYILEIGTTDDPDFYYSGNQGANTSATINGLPADGSVVKVSLHTRIGTSWYDSVYGFYTFDQSVPTAVEMTEINSADSRHTVFVLLPLIFILAFITVANKLSQYYQYLSDNEI